MISEKRTDDVSGAARPAELDTPTEESEEVGNERNDANHASEGQDDELGMRSASPSVPPPPQVADLGSACVRFVSSRYGATLDFAPDTLSFLDHWVREARAESASRPEVIEVVQAAAGAYLGEVIRRTFGGVWRAEGHHADWRLQFERVYCSFNPIGMAREALLLEPTEGWGAHFDLDPAEAEAIERRLAALPRAPDDEFYAPSTRFDVVCILFEALRGSLRARGLSDVYFTPEDYSA